MLYNLRPGDAITWSDMPAALTLKVVNEHDADLSRLEWQPLVQPVDADILLALALRYGVRTSTGIVLDAGDAAEVGRAAELRRLLGRAQAAHDEVDATHGSLLEGLNPGRQVHREAQAQAIANATEAEAARAEQQVVEQLARPVDEVLAEHWVALGGTLPR